MLLLELLSEELTTQGMLQKLQHNTMNRKCIKMRPKTIVSTMARSNCRFSRVVGDGERSSTGLLASLISLSLSSAVTALMTGKVFKGGGRPGRGFGLSFALGRLAPLAPVASPDGVSVCQSSTQANKHKVTMSIRETQRLYVKTKQLELRIQNNETINSNHAADLMVQETQYAVKHFLTQFPEQGGLQGDPKARA